MPSWPASDPALAPSSAIAFASACGKRSCSAAEGHLPLHHCSSEHSTAAVFAVLEALARVQHVEGCVTISDYSPCTGSSGPAGGGVDVVCTPPPGPVATRPQASTASAWRRHRVGSYGRMWVPGWMQTYEQAADDSAHDCDADVGERVGLVVDTREQAQLPAGAEGQAGRERCSVRSR
jgi:hypothetical protein